MGYKFFGTPYVPPLSDWAFMLKNEPRKKKFEEIPTETEILITHTPPINILDAPKDCPPDTKHRFGCKELREQVLTRIHPLYHIFGHVHCGYGTTSLEGTNFINAASCDDDYQAVNAPIYFELDPK